MTKKDKKSLKRILIAAAVYLPLFIADIFYPLQNIIGGKAGWLLPFSLYFAVYIYIGYDILFKAARNLVNGQMLDENFLMSIATLGAFALAIYRGISGNKADGFDEAVAVLMFYQVGEFFQRYATGRSRRSIAALMDIRPDYANVSREGEVVTVAPEEVSVGEIIVVNPGEKLPLDGKIEEGQTTVDAKALTGESAPCELGLGDEVLSGSVNLSSQIKVRVSRAFYDSTVSKILGLIENAASKKSKTENFITRFARIYTPVVVFSAIALGVIPSIITGEWSVWLYRALSFLVVSCPCAIVVSVPLSFVAALGASSRSGILIKGSEYIEKTARLGIVAFDKTGTLTKGNFAVVTLKPEERGEEILRLAATAEEFSAHPIAVSVKARYGKEGEKGYTLTNIAGEGVVATKNSETILCGNARLMKRYGVKYEENADTGTVVYVAKGGEFVGSLTVSDEIKEESKAVVAALNADGIKTVMLTGDGEKVAADVAEKLGLSTYRAALLPQNKVEEVEKLLKEKPENKTLCFAGDGINDAPVLMRADIGVAMGGVGSDAAIEAADIVLMKDDLSGLPVLRRIAKKTMLIVKENVIFSLAVKFSILALSAFGITNMWAAVFGDVGVAILAILNAMRVKK